jgi:hypothetical protein
MHPVARVSTNTLIKIVYILPEDGHRSGPKYVVVVHNKIEHEKHLLRTVVLIKVLVVHFHWFIYWLWPLTICLCCVVFIGSACSEHRWRRFLKTAMRLLM